MSNQPHKPWIDPQLRRDLVKLACVLVSLLGIAYLFVLNPALSTPTLCALVVSMLLSPIVASLERRAYPRGGAILIVFGAIGLATAAAFIPMLQSGKAQWSSLKEKAPAYFETTMGKLKTYELSMKEKYSFLENAHPTDALVAWGKNTGQWFVQNGAAIFGDVLTWLFIVPLLTFFMLSDGPGMRRRLFQMIPNRFFEVTFSVFHEITTAISDYLRAKLVEALLVGLMVFAGLYIVGAPYALVLGIIGGVTNILPYVGPVIGAVPGVLIASLDSSQPTLIWWVAGVYLVANIIDSIVIFPVVVAKLVDLHPMILIVAVIIGQQFYGLIGMLISIPIASALKVVLIQIYAAVYEQRGRERRSEIIEG